MRERGDQDIQDKNGNGHINHENDDFREILVATLNALHSHMLHKKQLFRLMRNKKDVHFVSFEDEKQDKEDIESALSIEFGINILQWLKYDEKPIFNSFREEIIGNPTSTIEPWLYRDYVKECFIRLTHQRKEHYQLNELLSMKFYTDCTDFQRELGKAFWSRSSPKIKQSFYQWAIQLYKAALYHSKPVPTLRSGDPVSVFHGLFFYFCN